MELQQYWDRKHDDDDITCDSEASQSVIGWAKGKTTAARLGFPRLESLLKHSVLVRDIRYQRTEHTGLQKNIKTKAPATCPRVDMAATA